MPQAPTGLKKYLDYHFYKSAVNNYLFRHVGGNERPVFHDIDKVCPELHSLTARYTEIQAEFDAVAAEDLHPYHEVDPGEAEISAGGDPDTKWNVFMLYVLGHRIEKNLARCPVTDDLISGIPNIVQAFFSILDPHKSVPLHEGPYYGYLRYHLGLRVPAENPPSLIVAGQPYVWREGEATLFDDSWPHEVVNHADEERAVLIVDIMRPMRRMPHAVNGFVTGVVARNTYGRSIARRVRRAASEARDALG